MRTHASESFSEVAAGWLDAMEPELKYSSRVRYINLLNSYLLPEFGEMPISGITRDALSNYRLKLLRNGGEHKEGLSPTTMAAIFSVFKSIIEYARYDKGYETDDFRNITIRQAQQPLRVFSRIEQQRLVAYLLEHTTLTDLGILIALYMGLRVGEVCALKWGDIHTEDWTLHVHHTMQRIQDFGSIPRTKVIITDPKSLSSIRIIPIPSSLQPLLLRHRKEDTCFLLTGKAQKYVEPRTMENQFRRILTLCGISNATFHTCRHTFATRCIELGFDIKTLSEILGHASVAITMNRYVHPSMDFKRQSMDKLSTLLS